MAHLYINLNKYFQFLNNITRIFIHFFIYIYLKKIKNYYLNTRIKCILNYL